MKVVRQRILAAALAIGGLLCLYLAWRPSPILAEVSFIPYEFARWADAQFNLRTALPFVGLGFVSALFAYGNWCRLRLILIGLFAFSILLEVGQLFILTRSPNFEDVFFGCAGAVVGTALGSPLFFWHRAQGLN